MPRPNEKFYPGFNDENLDRDKKIKDELGAEINKDDLAYNKDDDSYEMDVESSDQDYDHPDPYDTSAPNGKDFDSDYDSANPTISNEYDKNASLETDLDDLGMHVNSGNIVELSDTDEDLARTPEDDRDDLDEEGYPKRDNR